MTRHDLDHAAIWARLIAGESRRQVAETYGIHRNTLTRRLRDNGYPIDEFKRKAGNVRRELDLDPIIDRVENGESVLSIAKEIGWHTATLSKRLNTEGGPRYRRARRHAQRVRAAVIREEADRDCPLGCGRPARHDPAEAFKSGPVDLPACDGTRQEVAA